MMVAVGRGGEDNGVRVSRSGDGDVVTANGSESFHGGRDSGDGESSLVFPEHEPGVPTLLTGLGDALAESSEIDVAVLSLVFGGWLADNELVGGDASDAVNLEDGGLGEATTRSEEEVVAGGVLVITLVIELQVVKVDEVTSLLVDLGVGTSSVHGREPRSDGSVRDDEALGRRQHSADSLGVLDEPVLGTAIVLVHGLHILVIDIETLEVVVENELSVLGGEAGSVDTIGSGRLGGTKGRGHNHKTSIVILVEDLLLVRVTQLLPLLALIGGALDEQESEDQMGIALESVGRRKTLVLGAARSLDVVISVDDCSEG